MTAFTEELKQVRNTAELVYDENTMEASYNTIAEQVSEALSDRSPLLLPVMLGGMYLCGKLMSRLDFPLEIDYLHATRYRDRLQGDELHWPVQPSSKIAGRTVLLIDDILDQGITLSKISERVKQAGAVEVLSAVMTCKLCDREEDFDVTFKGVDVPDRYVFGCGMDYKGYWRNLPAVYAVAEK